MIDPETRKQRLAAAIEESGWTNDYVGKQVGVTGARVGQWLSGDEIPPRRWPKLSAMFGKPTWWWSHEKEPPLSDDVCEIAIVDARTAAGAGAINEHAEKIGSLLFRPRSLTKKGINPDRCLAVYVEGDSMYPRLRSGDTIVYQLSDDPMRFTSGKMHVIQWGPDEGASVKRLFREPDGRIRVSSDNKLDPEYQDRIIGPYETGFKVIGRVRWVGSWDD